MTPPDTNLKTQRRRHRPALYAIAFAAIFGLLTLLVRIFAATDPTSAVEDPAVMTPTDETETSPVQNPPRLPQQP